MTLREILASLREATSNGIEWIKERRGLIGSRFRGVVPPAVPVKGDTTPAAEDGNPAGEASRKTVSAGWSVLKKFVAVPTIALMLAVALALKQWVQSPIAIESFTTMSGSSPGLSADMIADQLKEIGRASCRERV